MATSTETTTTTMPSKESRRIFTNPSEGPIPLIATPSYTTKKTDAYTAVATEMAVIHNIYIRGYNSIHIQAPHIPAFENKSFIGYSLAWANALGIHHDAEEEVFFPELEKATGEKGVMAENIAQHAAFHDGLTSFKNYLVGLKGREADFDGRELVRIMESFEEVLAQHLVDEIPSLQALERYGDALDIKAICEKDALAAQRKMSPVAVTPVILLNHDPTCEGGLHANWPPMPPPVRFVFKHILTWVHAGYWKFTIADTWGKPRELPYAPKSVEY